MDLYRLPEHTNRQYFMLNLDHVFKNCISLVEWPERLPAELVPEERLEISIDFAKNVQHDEVVDSNGDNQCRIMTFNPIGHLWRSRVYDMRYMGYIEDLLIEEKEEFNPNEPQR
jgi:Threonylcarbamoyl adenosine biosynthesis protein TsaE